MSCHQASPLPSPFSPRDFLSLTVCLISVSVCLFLFLLPGHHDVYHTATPFLPVPTRLKSLKLRASISLSLFKVLLLGILSQQGRGINNTDGIVCEHEELKTDRQTKPVSRPVSDTLGLCKHSSIGLIGVPSSLLANFILRMPLPFFCT